MLWRRLVVAAGASAVLMASSVAAAPHGAAAAGDGTATGDVAAFADERLAATADDLTPSSFPVRTTRDGRWLTAGADDWTAGFLPAALWRTYERTHDPRWRDRARRWTAPLAREAGHDDTDLGFKMGLTFGTGADLTGDPALARTALAAADTLARRFDPTVGMVRVWDERDDTSRFRVNIDAMMNLELLYWAGEHGRPRDTAMANRHAERTARDLVRPDGSTFMFASYDQGSGRLLRRYTEQGAADDSTWSRGQAWAIHGFAAAYHHTHDRRFLDTAHRTADDFLAHLPPDRVPYWDFSVTQAPPEPRDTSASAVAASGLLALAADDPDPARRSADVDAGRGLLRGLSAPAYLTRGGPERSILRHGTQNRPDGESDSGIMFGDYYFVEALGRYQRLPGPLPPLGAP